MESGEKKKKRKRGMEKMRRKRLGVDEEKCRRKKRIKKGLKNNLKKDYAI